MNIENRLLLAAKRMDKKALAEIFDLYARPLYNYALRCCSDPLLADQIVGDVFAKFLEQLAAGKGPLNNLRSYLFEITFNSVVDEARYASHRTSIELVDSRYGKFTVNPDVEDQMQLEKLSQAIKRLTPDQRHVIILRFLEGFSLSETAAILKKSIGCVKITQFRAIWNLRIALGMEPPDSLGASELEMAVSTPLDHAAEAFRTEGTTVR
jgi:RNA polymerase sigma-70 factor (ECF subfamily)